MRMPWCEICQKEGHYKTFCWQNKKKPIKKLGKQGQMWISERKYFIQKTLPPEGYWKCHYCGVKLVDSRENIMFIDGEAMILTIDHIRPRSNYPKGRYDIENLVPCCGPDNVLKGSQSYVKFCERWYPHLLEVIP